MRLIRRPLPRVIAALTASAASVSLTPAAFMVAAPPVHALSTLPAQSQTGVNGTYATDGSGTRTEWLLGGYQLVSAGALNLEQSGGAVTLGVSAGDFTASVGSNSQNVGLLSYGGPGTPWASALLAASRGSDGQYWGGEGAGYTRNGGYGGAVNLTVSPVDPLRPVEILLDTTTLPAVTGTLTLNGVLALSQGGRNSSRWTYGLFTGHNDYYSQSGSAGAVTVDFRGNIRSQGGYASALGALVLEEVGIAAISRGGAFQCDSYDCLDHYNANFNYETPGVGGAVDVTLRSGSQILLQQGAATGIYALSANGGIPSEGAYLENPTLDYNINTSGLVAGNVTVVVEDGAAIRVGSATALASAGVIAISAGSELGVDDITKVYLTNAGGEGVGRDVTVSNAGEIEADGILALGIGALSLGGEAAVGVLGVAPGEYRASKKSPPHPGTLGTVRVTNDGSITTSGDSSHGIVAGSLGAGGVIYAALAGDEAARKAIAESCVERIGTTADEVRENAALGELPLCNGVTTGLTLGNSSGGSAVNGGEVFVTNHGVITTGLQGLQEASEHAMGIFAQSVGGGGGNGSGGFLFWAGDAGGAGGSGGNVTVTNTGDISTYGSFATGVLAQSIGGGGGVGGSTNFLPWIAVGARGGSGGSAGSVTVSLDGAGTIATAGEFAQGVLAQSVGGGGGVGGASNAYGETFTLAVGGPGGVGGSGGAVSVNALGNDDKAWNAATNSIDETAFDIITLGEHGTGILAQSIGGGGGVGGHARSVSGSVLLNINLSFGGSGGTGGAGGATDVFSDLDILSQGSDAIGILAQSIGGGGGTGGGAYSNAITLEVPSEGDIPVPNFTYVGAFGGKGGTANAANAVHVYNGGLVATGGEGAIGILAQSVGGGGGAGGDATAISRAVPLKVKGASEGKTIAVNVVTAVGGNGGTGGHGGEVIVHNASHGGLGGGAVVTEGDHGAGIVAQSIGGGGGKGGDADAALYTDSLGEFIQDLANLTPPEKQAREIFSINVAVAVGGTGGAGGDAGYVQVYNGEQTQTTSGIEITPAMIQTSGGASPGIVAQSIGGGGGSGGEGAVSGMGAAVTINVGVGGSGGSGGAGGEVYVLNPAGASIRTGDVVLGEATEEDINAGTSPFALVTTGGGAVGILAQSIGGGGGTGGNADAASALDNSWQSDAAMGVSVMSFFLDVKKAMGKDGKFKDVFEPAVNADIAVGGSGGASGDGRTVLVDSGGAIETFGEQAHGIQAQSIGAGGGSGGAVEATSAFWQSKVASIVGGETEVTIGMSVGGKGGAAGNGGAVTVNQYAGASILTHGYGANGIFAQSIGGGGGYGGHATANSEGFVYIGGTIQGNEGATGHGGTVNVSSAGSIETWGDDANGILAQSIGGGGGSGVVGCTNSENGFPIGVTAFGGASPCWGNNESTDGDAPKWLDWGSFISISGNLGGGKSYKTDTGDDGGTVSVHLSNALVTHGNRSMGLVAQSIGGGGGFLSGDATAFAETIVAPDAGHSHSHGRAVSVDIDTGGSITTYGDGAWGVLAQSIGGSGGFVGDSSLNLGLLVSNTISPVCCSYRTAPYFDPILGRLVTDLFSYNTGADGGDVTVNLAANTSITTHGRNAHGIVAQSVGGGGGVAAGARNDPNAFVYMGNPLAAEWNGENPDDPILWTGMGGKINIDIAAGATVDAQGEGSIGILAQSTGDKNFQSQINITVDGTVIGGSGYNNAGNLNMLDQTGTFGTLDAAAIVVSGGDAYNNTLSTTPPNQITIGATGRVQGRDQYHDAIVSTYGRTHVTSYGYILGAIKLGSSTSDPNLGVFTNHGTWVAGITNIFSNNSVHNYGVIEIVQPTVVEGSLKHYAGGEIRFHLDPAVHVDQAALTVSGLARLEGKITPVLDELLPGELRLLKAGSIESSASIDNPFLFDWAQRVTADAELHISALADFRPAGMHLTGNQEAAAVYLEKAWENADPYLAGHFAYMLRLDSAQQHGGMLDALGGAELLHQHDATLQAIPTLLGDAIDCPTMGGADVIVGEDSCAWMGVGQSWGRYSGKDTRRNDTDGDLFSFGLQKEFRPGWYLSGVIGRLSSDADADTLRSSGRATIGSLGLKHQSGNWILGASLAWGSGSYDSVRRFALPLAGGGASAPEAVLRSDSEMDIRALRARVSYEFGFDRWYLRPTLDVDALQTETSGFDEEAGEHLFRLSGDGDSQSEVVATPHVELGRLFDLGSDSRLRAYVDAGVRLAPDADREMDVRISGANASIGFIRNRVEVPVATGLLKVGAQIYRDDALDLRLEYGLEANDDFRNETATARVAWHF